jgi:hypothetical protein
MLNKHSGDLKEQSIAERENIGKLLPFKIGADSKLKRIVEAESVGSRGVKARRVIVDGSNSSPIQSTERDQLTSNDGAETTVRSDFYGPFGKSNAPTTAIDAKRTRLGSESYTPAKSSKAQNIFSNQDQSSEQNEQMAEAEIISQGGLFLN